jgi:phage head maturation protease
LNIIKAYIPLQKIDEEQRMVYGYASTEALDSQGETITRAAIIDALPDYMRFANIREMHTMSAVGVCKSAEPDEQGVYIAAKVVDDAAWAKVKEGVYKGFSVGGKSLAKSDGQITKMRLTEISLVDRPANPECVIDTWKADADQPEQQAEQPVAKSLWSVNNLLEAIGNLRAVCFSADYEVKEGQHTAEISTALKGALTVLADVTQKYLGEELSSLLAMTPGGAPITAGEPAGDIAKAGARYSKATKEALAKVHGMLRDCDKAMGAMGYDAADDDGDEATKGEQSGDVAKADVLTDDVRKAAADAGIGLAEGATQHDLMKAALGELAKSRARVLELEAMPAPMKGVRTVAKGDDTNGNDLVAAEQPDMNDPMAAFKAVLSRPVAFAGR